ncbi:murein tripeptide/oligopeptide ABC transporter ATP-binding protein OppD [soil metagenome]
MSSENAIEATDSELLKFAHVSVSFATDDAAPTAPAVDDVTLALRRGEIFGIVGESGSGKSTLANAVMGLIPGSAAVTGSIQVNGREIVGRNDSQLRSMRGDEVSMIFQDASASLDPTWSVGDQIAETIRAHRKVSRRDAKAQATALMTEVGIPDAATRYRDAPHRLSGGQRQRIVIAAALANSPQLLIADEPTTALDVTIQAQVLELINRLRKIHSTTVLLISHDLGVIAQICDQVGVMYGGTLLEVAPTQELFSAPKHPYTRALLAANPAGAPRGTRLPVIPAAWSVESLHEAELLARVNEAEK